MNKTIVCPPLYKQSNLVKESEEKSQVIDIRKYVCFHLEKIHQGLIADVEKKAGTCKKIVFLYFNLMFPLGSMPLLNLEKIQEEKNVEFVFAVNSNPYDPIVFSRLKTAQILFENMSYQPIEWNIVTNYFLFLSKLSEAEKRVLRLAIRGEANFQPSLKPVLDYLIGTKILEVKNGKLKAGSKKLNKEALKIQSLSFGRFTIKKDQIFLEEKNVGGFFSPHQKALLSILVKHKNKAVRKDSIARKIWGAGWREKYSDWYLDHLIFMVRKKLKQLWYSSDKLTTVKKIGFMLKE